MCLKKIFNKFFKKPSDDEEITIKNDIVNFDTTKTITKDMFKEEKEKEEKEEMVVFIKDIIEKNNLKNNNGKIDVNLLVDVLCDKKDTIIDELEKIYTEKLNLKIQKEDVILKLINEYSDEFEKRCNDICVLCPHMIKKDNLECKIRLKINELDEQRSINNNEIRRYEYKINELHEIDDYNILRRYNNKLIRQERENQQKEN